MTNSQFRLYVGGRIPEEDEGVDAPVRSAEEETRWQVAVGRHARPRSRR
jgi:hypothetical protein